MVRCHANTTNPALLNRLGVGRDHEAMVDFATRYAPLIRLSRRRSRLRFWAALGSMSEKIRAN
jgi:hypothetical protein